MNTRIYPLIVLTLATHAQALTVAEYDFVGGSSADSASALGVTASAFGITGYSTDFSGFSSSTETVYVFKEAIATSITASIAADDYLGFTVTPTSGSLSFDTLDFSQIVSNATSPTNSPTFTVSVFTSETGFTDGDAIATFSMNTTATGFTSEARSISLSAIPELQGVTGTTEIRFYFATNATYSNVRQGVMRLDGISLSTIPEPGAMGLCLGAAALLGVVGRRRLRRR